MYETFFGLSERPFAAAPTAKHYFPAAAIEAARQTLVRCIQRAEGVALLIGPAGTGKTLLCHVLADEFRNRYSVALLESGRLCTRRALLQAILFELGLPYRGMEEGDLRLALVDHLSPRNQDHDSAAKLLLIVDEAHSLPLRLLEELRLLSNLVRQGQPRVRLALAGGPQFEERLASPKLESFNQRIAARCYLEALDRSQTIDYVRHQIRDAGGSAERIFTSESLAAVYQATDGIPRLINQVCDHALVLACAGGVKQLSAGGIEEAWSDLQQLPTPWNAAPGAPDRDAPPAAIEFGELDEELSDDLPSALPFRAVSDVAEQHQLLSTIGETAGGDDEFQPAGTIRPEVELHFQRTANPFHEAFDEEEVVLDPYTANQGDEFADLPLVYTDGAHELGPVLTHLTGGEQPAAAGGASPWAGGLPNAQYTDAASQAPDTSQQSDTIHSAIHPAAELETTEASQPETVDPWRHVPELEDRDAALPGEETSRAIPSEPPKIPKLSRPIPVTRLPPSLGHESDADLIEVDDLPRPPAPEVPKEPPPKRRHEFRQLFAKLRRE